MAETTVTQKGQITLPKELRERFGIEEGDQVEVTRKGEDIVVRKVKRDFETALGSWSDLDLNEDLFRKLRGEWEERLDRVLR